MAFASPSPFSESCYAFLMHLIQMRSLLLPHLPHHLTLKVTPSSLQSDPSRIVVAEPTWQFCKQCTLVERHGRVSRSAHRTYCITLEFERRLTRLFRSIEGRFVLVMPIQTRLTELTTRDRPVSARHFAVSDALGHLFAEHLSYACEEKKNLFNLFNYSMNSVEQHVRGIEPRDIHSSFLESWLP